MRIAIIVYQELSGLVLLLYEGFFGLLFELRADCFSSCCGIVHEIVDSLFLKWSVCFSIFDKLFAFFMQLTFYATAIVEYRH